MPGHSPAFRSIFRNVGVLTAGRIARAACSFVYVALTVRAIGLSGYGLLVLIHSLAMTGSLLSRMQSWQTLIRYGSEAFESGDRQRLGDVVSFCIRLDGISAVLAFCFSEIAVLSYGHGTHWDRHVMALAALYACVSPFLYTGWCGGVLRMAGRFHLVPVIDTATAILRTFGVLAGYLLGGDLVFFLAVWAVTALLDFNLYLHFALKVLREKIAFRYLAAFAGWRWSLPGMWRFTRVTSINQTLGLISGDVSTLLVGGGLGPAEAAIFRVCRQIANGIATPAQLIAPVLYPELVRMRDRQDWAGLRKVTWRMFFLLAGISALLLSLTALFGSRIFALMLHVHVPHTSLYISVMLVAAVFSLLIVPLEPLLIVLDRARYLARNRLIVTAVYFPAVYVLTRRFGLAGASLSTAACNLAILFSCLIGVWRFSRRPGLTSAL